MPCRVAVGLTSQWELEKTELVKQVSEGVSSPHHVAPAPTSAASASVLLLHLLLHLLLLLLLLLLPLLLLRPPATGHRPPATQTLKPPPATGYRPPFHRFFQSYTLNHDLPTGSNQDTFADMWAKYMQDS